MGFIFFVFLFLVLFVPLFRCLVFNLHNVMVYGVKDIYEYFKYKKWKDFNYYGIDMFIAMFGHGKTLSMTHKVSRLYKKFGDTITIYSNYKLIGIPYIPLVNFNQLVDLGEEYGTGKVGTVVLIDEISSVLSHRNYSSFPLELIGLLCQQRKKKVYIMCTAQRFFMVDKIWRSITTNVIDCNKYWRFQHNSYYDAWDYENAMNAKMVQRISHCWWFVLDEHFRTYDTSEMIGKNSAKDFISNEEAIVRKGLDSAVNDIAVQKPSRQLKKIRKGK